MQYYNHEPEDNVNYRNRKGRFRLQTSQLFLTYPRCPIEKDKILKALKKVPALQDNINLHLVVQEPHRTEECSDSDSNSSNILLKIFGKK